MTWAWKAPLASPRSLSTGELRSRQNRLAQQPPGQAPGVVEQSRSCVTRPDGTPGPCSVAIDTLEVELEAVSAVLTRQNSAWNWVLYSGMVAAVVVPMLAALATGLAF